MDTNISDLLKQIALGEEAVVAPEPMGKSGGSQARLIRFDEQIVLGMSLDDLNPKTARAVDGLAPYPLPLVLTSRCKLPHYRRRFSIVPQS